MRKMKARTKYIPLFMAFFSVGSVGYSQVSVKGKVREEVLPLPGVSIMLIGFDSTLVKGVVSDSVGEFIFENVKEGEYRIVTQMIGYSRYYSQPTSVNDKNIVLQEIVLKEEETHLNEIIVSEQREMFEQKSDRMVMNLENSASSSGNSVLEVLQKSPGVVVDKQSNIIRINGRAGITVMINGKSMQLSAEGVMQMLEGMSVSNTEKLEIITSPQARYDAEGGGGVINIITKQQSARGTNGSFGVNAGATWAETGGGNLNVVHKTNHLTLFVDYTINRRHNLHQLNTYQKSREEEFDREVTAYSYRPNLTTQQNLRTGLEWKLNNKSIVNLGVTAYRRNWRLNADTEETDYAAQDSTLTTHIKITEINLWQSATGSLSLQQKFNAKNELNVSVDYLYYSNSNPSHYNVNSFFEQGNTNQAGKIDLTKHTPIHFLVSRADYHYQQHDSLSWDVGIKSVYSTLNNIVNVDRKTDQGWENDPVFSSSSVMNESIYAAFISNRWITRQSVELNTGMRYEFTHTAISSETQQDLVKRKYGYFFPSVSIRKNLQTEKDIQFSYARRITRPGYNDIAPFVFFWGTHTFSAGNTTLYPAIVDALTTRYHMKQWTTSFHFTHSKNEIAPLQPEHDDEGNLIYRSQNLKSLNTFGIANSYSASVYSWWELQASVTIQYQVAQSLPEPAPVDIKLFGVNATVFNRFKFANGISIELSANYQSRTLSGITQFLPMGSLNVGVQKSFGKNGTLTLAMDDILYTTNWEIKTNIPESNLVSSFKYDWHNQYIRLTYIRSFGKLKQQGLNNKSGAEEERGRVK